MNDISIAPVLFHWTPATMTLSPKCPNERYREVVSQCLPTPVKVKDKANILLQNAGSGCQILQSKGLMYKVFEGAHFTPSNYQCSFSYTGALVSQCPNAALPQCHSAPVPQCPSAPVHAPILRNSIIPKYSFPVVPKHHCFRVAPSSQCPAVPNYSCPIVLEP